MKTIGIIPARWASKRFEGKVLADIKGKPMIQHVWERATKASYLDEVIIACDDERIVKAAEGFNAKAVLTSVDHPSGTDRVIEAAGNIDAQIVVNIQGDEPLIDPQAIDRLAGAVRDDRSCLMATLIKVLDDPKELVDPNVVKVVLDKDNNALYFSRSPIPYDRDKDENILVYKHIGIYAYQKSFLLRISGLSKGRLERAERLEQLRVLEAGYNIKTVLTNKDTIGVDTKEDLEKAKAFL